jgi:hypothetical protein
MRTANVSARDTVRIDPLEPRRLLSLTPVGGEVVLPPPGETSDYDLAVADDGSYMVASASTGVLNVTRFAPTGLELGAPLTLASSGASSVTASMDPDGDAVVAWTQFQGNDMVDFFFCLIAKDGVAGEPVMVGATVNDNEEARFSPAVSMDDSGGFFLAWLYHAPGPWRETVQVRAFDAAGQPRAAQFEIVAGDTLNALGKLDIAAHPDGSGAVFALDQNNENGFTFIRLSRVSTTAAVGDLGVVADNGTHSDEADPSVVVYPDGSFALAYTRFNLPNRNDDSSDPTDQASFVQRFDADGQAVGGEIALGASLGGGTVEAAAIDALPGGGFVATYVHTSGDTNTLYVERFDADGTPFGDDTGPVAIDSGARIEWTSVSPTLPPVEQTEHTATFASPKIAADAAGRAVVAYTERAIDASNPNAFPDPGPVHIRMLANDFAEIRDGNLHLLGSDAHEAINIRQEASSIVVDLNATTRTFDADEVSGIIVNGFGGDDTIINDTPLPSTLLGGAGDDKLLSGDGADSLSGGDGKDKLLGRGGRDSLSGNAGNDTLEGGPQPDRVAGNGGRDRLYGGASNDRLYGGANGDWLYGQGGNDQLFGGGGNDRLYGDDAGSDSLHGGAGNDMFFSRGDSAMDDLFGNGGDDTAMADEDDVLTGIESAV